MVESRSVIRNAKNARGLRRDRAERHFSRRHRPLSQVVRVLFRFARFNTFPLYYLRAWHRLIFCVHIAGVKNNKKVDSLLLKSRQCNQRCPLLGVSRTHSILFNTVNAEAWELSQAPPFPIVDGFELVSIS